MSDGGRTNKGRPDAMVEASYLYFFYCGGKGGGGCLSPLGVTGVTLEYRVPKFIVFNKRIIFENREFYGVQIYTDAGPDGLGCSHSLGSDVGFYMALSADGFMTDAEIMERGKFIQGALPFTIEFTGTDLPQPTDAGWVNKVFVHLYWGNTGYINGGNSTSNVIDEDAFRITKHDYDVKL